MCVVAVPICCAGCADWRLFKCIVLPGRYTECGRSSWSADAHATELQATWPLWERNVGTGEQKGVCDDRNTECSELWRVFRRTDDHAIHSSSTDDATRAAAATSEPNSTAAAARATRTVWWSEPPVVSNCGDTTSVSTASGPAVSRSVNIPATSNHNACISPTTTFNEWCCASAKRIPPTN